MRIRLVKEIFCTEAAVLPKSRVGLPLLRNLTRVSTRFDQTEDVLLQKQSIDFVNFVDTRIELVKRRRKLKPKFGRIQSGRVCQNHLYTLTLLFVEGILPSWLE